MFTLAAKNIVSELQSTWLHNMITVELFEVFDEKVIRTKCCVGQ